VNSAGGAERVLCNMANEMTERGHSVTVVINDMNEGFPFYPLHRNVEFVNLDGSGQKKKYPLYLKIMRAVTRPLRQFSARTSVPDPIEILKYQELCPKLNKLVRRIEPDVIVSFFLDDHDLMSSAVDYRQYPLVVMHHGPPQIGLLVKFPKKIESLRKAAYLQLLMPSYEKQVNAVLPWLKTITIPNAVEPIDDQFTANLDVKKEEYTITMLCRQQQQKQPHFLINAFSLIAKKYPHWKVRLYGDGDREYMNYLGSLIQKNELENQVFQMGKTNQPVEVLRQSDIFAFPTSYEGFPLALTEAMAVGLPCVGLKTAPAVNELIIHGKNGLLAENNEQDFAAELIELMDDPQRRAAMGKYGHEFVKQFAPKKIWDKWENLLLDASKHNRPVPQLQNKSN
jgi:glycosyltransferase involved in cell wall biosynthesis